MPEKTIGFEEAVQKGEEILIYINEHGVDDARKQAIEELLATAPAARGFFIALLTDNCKLADDLPPWLVDSIGKGGEHIPDLLAKNIVMSTTMKITHDRQNDAQNAAGSEMVARRTTSIIRAVNQELVRVKLKEMRTSLKLKSGVYADFLNRWKYDAEQIAAAIAAIDRALEQPSPPMLQDTTDFSPN